MKKAFSVILVLCILVGLTACGGSEPVTNNPTVLEQETLPEDLVIPLGDTGVKVEIPGDVGFERFESELNDFFGGSPGGTWLVIVNVEPKSDYPDCTLADYVALSAQANEAEFAQESDGNYFFTYTNEYSADEIYKFYTAVRENDEQYYRIAFYCPDFFWENYGQQFAAWAKTIEVE